MAGGFSMSEYLFNEVKAFANREADIAVQRADEWYVFFIHTVNLYLHHFLPVGSVL
jgi:hypothetical protein